MSNFSSEMQKPVCVGAGLIALDVVINGNPQLAKLYAGGSCGNVMAILAFLGWSTFPIVRLGEDVAGRELLRDLCHWNVHTEFVLQSSLDKTPIVVQRITRALC